ncbi:MAG TPA: DUF6515 family protein [Ignavibacteriales bacterium]|nr:DUF6515 family protein [Ignavibacteriales bacterium]
MKTKLFKFNIMVLFVFTILFIMNVNVEAQHRRVVIKHDRGTYREVVVKDRHYFYRDGYFFDRGPRGYTRVVAPIGARVVFLPRGYEIVRIGRERYYVFGGVYYRYLPREKVYIIVERPR